MLAAALSANLSSHSTKPPGDNNGTNPQTFLQTHLPWVDQSTLTSLLDGKLDVKDLLRLIPAEDRPRGRTTAIPGLVSFDNQTGKFIQSDDIPTTFDKDFLDSKTALHVLSVYGAIRSLYDVDKTGVAPGIFLYIKQLTRWILIDRFSWHHVRAYFVAHFRKYQASTDPLSWMNIDACIKNVDSTLGSHINQVGRWKPDAVDRCFTPQQLRFVANRKLHLASSPQ